MTNRELMQAAYMDESSPTEKVLATRLGLAIDYIMFLEAVLEQHDLLPAAEYIQ